MIEIALLPRFLHISYAADDSETVSISADEYLFIRHVFADAGYTELPDGTWTEAPVNYHVQRTAALRGDIVKTCGSAIFRRPPIPRFLARRRMFQV